MKLGLTESEAQHFDEPEEVKYTFARDQVGIGYSAPQTSLPDLDSTFARLAAISKMKKNDAPKIEAKKPAQTRFFIPSRLKKKSIGSLSNEDLTSIFMQPTISDKVEEVSNDDDDAPTRNKVHYKHYKNTENNVSTPIESPVISEEQKTRRHHHKHHRSHNVSENNSSEIDQQSNINDSPATNIEDATPAQNETNETTAQIENGESPNKRRRRRHHRTVATE